MINSEDLHQQGEKLRLKELLSTQERGSKPRTGCSDTAWQDYDDDDDRY